MSPTAPPPSPTRPIRFYHRGALVEVNDVAPTRTVLDWLRENARATGTKEGCNEGDCGACTVVIGAPAAAGDPTAVRGLALKTVNACIRFLPTLDGMALFTVEDLKAMTQTPHAAAPGEPAHPAGASAVQAVRPKDSHPVQPVTSHPVQPAKVHPVQQAMVDCHGSQCGFCTPGFVMSLWSTYERSRAQPCRPTRQQLADELSGNLCRCTGYRPILDAGQRMFDLPGVELDTAPVLEALAMLTSDPDLNYTGPGTPIVATRVPVGIIPAASTSEPTRAVAAPPARFHAPTTLAALAALRWALPQAQIVSGSTDVGLWVNKQFRPLGDMLYVGRVDELKRIVEADGELRIGAGATLEAAFTALAAHAPTLVDAWLRFASPPIRNAGTLGGNVANGSPIGDAPPILMALDAEIELRQNDTVRRMPLDLFYVDYMKNRMEPGEFVQGLAVPLAAFGRHVRAYKISKRFDSDISAVFGGFAIELDGTAVKTVRLAYGGMAATARRAVHAEAALRGQPWTEASAAAAQTALVEDFEPLSDMRASAGYRLQVAQNLIRRFWLETRPADPLPASSTSVYSGMPHRSLSGAGAAA